MIFISAAEYGILIWLPMYLEEKHFANFEGFISITFSIFNLLGGTLFGLFYEKFPSRKFHFSFNLVAIIIGMGFLILIYLMDMKENQKWTLLVFVGFIGLLIGGLYDCYLAT